MPAEPKLTEARVIAVLRETQGRIFLAAKKLGISVRTLENYQKRWPAIKEIIEEEHGRMLDLAETTLYAAILKGEAWAICFHLKCKGKKRGWTERTELKHTGDTGASQIQVYIPDNGRDVKQSPAAARSARKVPRKRR